MPKDPFKRSKPHFNLGIISHENDAKSLLTASLSIIFGTSSSNNTIEFETANRHYSIIQSPNHSDYVKNMITGAAPADGVILLISAVNNPVQQIRESLLLARQIGLTKIVVFLDKCDIVNDAEMLELIEVELREQISQHEFDGNNTPIIRGSAKKAFNGETEWKNKIVELMDACDNYLPLPQSNIDKPFLMAIEDIFSITGRGTVVTGRIERGSLHMAETVERVGIRETATFTITGIEMFRKILDEAQAGDNVGVLLRGAMKNDFVRGMVLAAPGSIFAYTDFKADIYLLSKEEGGRHTPITNGYRPQFFFRTTDVTGTMQIPAGTMITPGSTATINVKLILPIAMEKGTRFAIREGGRTVGSGIVTELPNKNSNSFRMTIKESYTIIGRGAIVSGTIESGVIHVNDKVKCSGAGKSNEFFVLGINVSNKNAEEAKAGDKVEILLRGASKEDAAPGMVLTATT